MTREEAIKIIRKMLACTDLSVRANLNADMVDACHMAIKALEQEPNSDIRLNSDKNELNRVKNELEPITKNDLGVNCIDKTELLKAMDTWDKFGNEPNEGLIPLRTPALQDRYVPYVKYDDMVNCVKGMSSVTPIRPKGHWIMIELPTRYGHVCSECGNLALSDEYGNEYLTDFCPHCGADMKR